MTDAGSDARRQAARQLALIAKMHLDTDQPSLAVPVVVASLLALTAPDEPRAPSTSTSTPDAVAGTLAQLRSFAPSTSGAVRVRDPHVAVFEAYNPRACHSCPIGTSPHIERHYLSWRVGTEKHSGRACDARLLQLLEVAMVEQKNYAADEALRSATGGEAGGSDV